MKLVAISLYKFAKDRCYLRASALTFYSLLALVPAIAITMIIAQVLGLEDNLDALLQEQMQGQETTVKYLLKFASNLIYESRNSFVAGVGSILILGSIYKMFMHIRYNINEIWCLSIKNNIFRVLITFTTVAIFIPTVILITSALNLYIFTIIHSQVIQIYNSPEILRLLSLTSSYILIVLLFTWIYKVIPQTRVDLKYAFISAMITAAIHIIIQKLFIYAQVYMVKQSVIFGGFAAIPLLMSWLQIVWMTILFGSALTYILQFKPSDTQDLYLSNMPLNKKINSIIEIVESIHNRQEQDKQAPCAKQIQKETGQPITIVEQSITALNKAHIIATVFYHDEDIPRFILRANIKKTSDIRKIIINNTEIRI